MTDRRKNSPAGEGNYQVMWLGTSQAGRNLESIGKRLHFEQKPNAQIDVMVMRVGYGLGPIISTKRY